ncbi:MAG: YkgJ family cysteine cluster protein [Planctomycetes bacterium]|nr:YkgJ family cysteine cluster protein [Planctomycetota bacterium]
MTKPAEPRPPRGETRPWYVGGLRFGCTQCGRCCINHGDESFVYVSTAEMRVLARHLELDLATFRRRYTTTHEGDRVLKDAADRCIFLGADHRCRVHAARPVQCRTWPFWTENLEPAVWRGRVQARCPGIGRGRLYCRAEIEAQARAADATED